MQSNNMETLHFEDKDCNRWIKIKPDQEFTITLATPYACGGYIWDADRTYYYNRDTHLLELDFSFIEKLVVDTNDEKTHPVEPVIGGSANCYQVFKGRISKNIASNKMFSMALVLEYCKPWIPMEKRLEDENRKVFNMYLELE